MKTDAVFKEAYNEALDYLSALHPDATLPSENRLAAHLRVSRTTVRKVLTALHGHGHVTGSGRERRLGLPVVHAKRYPVAETLPVSAQLEKRFMEWMLREDARPGMLISEVDLARRFGTATAVVREFLNRFQRFGLIEKRRNAGWLFKGFTSGFALDLFEIREMFEHRSAMAFGRLPDDSPLWRQLAAMRDEHVALLDDIAVRYHDFSELDSRFHRLVNLAAPNRFVDGYYEVISLVFHYHYQWDKSDEQARNAVALREHLAYIDALRSRNGRAIERAWRTHLSSAKATLIAATAR